MGSTPEIAGEGNNQGKWHRMTEIVGGVTVTDDHLRSQVGATTRGGPATRDCGWDDGSNDVLNVWIGAYTQRVGRDGDDGGQHAVLKPLLFVCLTLVLSRPFSQRVLRVRLFLVCNVGSGFTCDCDCLILPHLLHGFLTCIQS
jgi:hypothetical protein